MSPAVSGPRATLPAQAATGLGTAAVVVAYAADRGTYDLIARQEFALVIWFALLLIAALGLLPARRPGAALSLALLALGLLAAWMAIGFGWTQSDERTLAEV